MSDDQLFLFANYAVLPAWILLAVAPRWAWTQRLVHSLLYPVLLGAAYTLGFLAAGSFSAGGESEAGVGSLAAVSAAFANPRTLLVGWVHYLCFDLFVGAWEARDAQRRGVPHWQLVPCLFLTLMAGPMGLLLYLGFRWMRARSTSLGEAA